MKKARLWWQQPIYPLASATLHGKKRLAVSPPTITISSSTTTTTTLRHGCHSLMKRYTSILQNSRKNAFFTFTSALLKVVLEC